uniref:SLAM family member 9-like n=1 Tax=Halichoerus grypus TaxID=9711 RepID=UPI001659E6DF|nr:SLAM family member 9-like [Halichoerus grypus]
MQAGPGGQRVLAAGTQAPFSRRWSALHRGCSLQIRPLRLQGGLYRAWITLHSPPINITKDFTLRVYEKLQEPNITVSSRITKDGACYITLICSLRRAREDVQYRWAPLGQGQLCPMGEPLSVSPGDSGSVTAIAAWPASRSARAPAPSPPGPSAQVTPSLCGPPPWQPWSRSSASPPAALLVLGWWKKTRAGSSAAGGVSGGQEMRALGPSSQGRAVQLPTVSPRLGAWALGLLLGLPEGKCIPQPTRSCRAH